MTGVQTCALPISFGPVQVNANNLVAVPPADTQGASTGVRVGGHLSHTVPTPATQVITPVLCSECHGIAVNTYTSGHSNGVSDVTFASATRANLGGVTPAAPALVVRPMVARLIAPASPTKRRFSLDIYSPNRPIRLTWR